MLSFRSLLIGLFVGLILASTGAVTWLGYSGTRLAIRELATAQINASLDSASNQVREFFQPADRILFSLSEDLKLGVLSTNKPIELATKISRMLPFERGISWISFGYADGRFAGAQNGHDAKFIHVSSKEYGGPLLQYRLNREGLPIQPASQIRTEKYDSRTRPWFVAAEDSNSICWTEPYEFYGGGRGVAASLAVRNWIGDLTGVFTVDFLLSDFAEYLTRMQKVTQSGIVVFLEDGKLLAASEEMADAPYFWKIQQIACNYAAKLVQSGASIVEEIQSDGETYIVGMQSSAIVGGGYGISAVVLNREKTFGPIEQTLRISTYAAGFAFVLSLVVAILVARRVASPLRLVTQELRRIERFELAPVELPRSSIREVQILSEAVARMRDSLQSFSHYVPVDIVRDLLQSGSVAKPGGLRHEVSVMFCDVEGFTTYAEKVSPEVSVKTLTQYFEIFGLAIHNHGGVIDKFLGDGMMALFNAPSPLNHHPAEACRAALQARRGLAGIRPLEGDFVPKVRVGLHTCEALVGNVGTSERFSYTAIGDGVNLCSRLESLNKIYGTWIIASSTLANAASGAGFLWRLLDRVAVVGREEPLEIFELMGFAGEANADQCRIADIYPQALQFYFNREFEKASKLFQTIASIDTPSRIILQRIASLQVIPPDADWSGVFKPSVK
jgi:adenylate cyclase